jgi:hypothetical protein
MRIDDAKLTDGEWRSVFRARCNSKKGGGLSEEDEKLCRRALRQDRKRYKAMEADVFDATLPAGSIVKWKR